jgi:hypothetical protein
MWHALPTILLYSAVTPRSTAHTAVPITLEVSQPDSLLRDMLLTLCLDACGPGDYCTSDTAGATYCCPEDIDPAECAIEFGVSTLIRQSTTAELPTTTASSDLPAETPTDMLTETKTDTEFFTTSSEIPADTPVDSSTTTGFPIVCGGMAMLAGAAGLAFF